MTGSLAGTPPLVLIAEPREVDARAIWEALEPAFTLMWTRNLAETLQQALTQKPSIVVMEIHWPEGEGYDLLEKLIAWRHAPIVVILTYDSSLAAKVQALQFGAASYIVKGHDDFSFWRATFAQSLQILMHLSHITRDWQNPLLQAEMQRREEQLLHDEHL